MLFPRPCPHALSVYRSPLLARVGVPHGFSTRGGGVSPAPFDSLNLGLSRDGTARDTAANVMANYERLMGAIGCDGRARCWVTQVHGAEVRGALAGEAFEDGAPADAIVCDDPGRAISVKYADCVPVLLATADGRAVAAAHAGWRGIVAGVVPAAVRRLAEISDDLPARFVAAIGPCIGVDAFEVGPEVLAAFDRTFGVAAPVRRDGDGGKGHVDLREAVWLQLTGAGLAAESVDTTDRCTFTHAAEFFSHRRDRGTTGRMAAVIGPRQGAAG